MQATVKLKKLGLSGYSKKRNAPPVDIGLIIVRTVWIGILGMFLYLGLTGRLDRQRDALMSQHGFHYLQTPGFEDGH